MAENSDGTARRRGVGRPFQSGVSPNPGGRPKALGDVRELARANTVRAIETLVRALDASDDRVRIAAANMLLDRGWGRPSSEAERLACEKAEANSVSERLRGLSREELFVIAGVVPAEARDVE